MSYDWGGMLDWSIAMRMAIEARNSDRLLRKQLAWIMAAGIAAFMLWLILVGSSPVRAGEAIVCWTRSSGAEVCTEAVPEHEAYDVRSEREGARIYQDNTWKYRDVTGKARVDEEIELDDDHETSAWRNLR
jgi:hypothetical protein